MKRFNVVWGLLWGASHRFMRRGKQRPHPLTASILILAMIAQVGCASSGTDKRSAPALLFPLPREAFQQLGTVAVTSGRFAPEFDIVGGPWKGGVGSVVGGGLLGFFAPLALGLLPPLIIAAPIFMPVGLVWGLKEGAKAEPAVKVEEREAAIREMVAAQRIQDDLRDRVVAIGRAETPYTMAVLAERGPITPGEQPDYRPLLQEGIQTVLEVVVESVTLQDAGGASLVDPQLGLVMTVNGRLVRTVDNLEIHAKRLTYSGLTAGKLIKTGQTLAEWVADSESFRNELNQAYADIAEKTVREMLLRGLD